MILHAASALLPDGWAKDVRIRVAAGRIVEVTAGVPGQGHGVILPAPVNLHSHTFQRAMAGLIEARTAGRDSFWSWRALMYRFLDRLSPEDVQAIAAQAMVEMAEAGFAAVCEFHYLHHPVGGGSYADPAEMSARIVQAARDTGLGLTHLPVIYEQGGVDGRALSGGQLRFGSSPEVFARVLESAGRALAGLPDAVLGVAPHSLRAVSRGTLGRVAGMTGGPIHIHIAEQLAEVAEVQAAWGARPVDWACANLPLDGRWCMIHATQMTPGEVAALARSGAVAGLCPITEANLGDGIFDGPGWLGAGGAFGVGTDSNVRISLAEELRLLEYSQRLAGRARAVMADHRSTGRLLWEAAVKGGAQAAGRGRGGIAVGEWADLLALDTGDLRLDGLEGDRLLDAFVFAGRDGLVSDLWSAGRPVVREGRHVAREAVAARFRATMQRLRDTL
ncbi:formimidoylglutamate deiminase [Rhodobacter calidifons]|uniref:Formimidoylglutamate deiminase n=1 Tax=Rhodobacter calidifons TaxID=2715277 RepID=A0ABX0G6P8_9RHOB|nr:formimidoylglutamate deiminase [Rhodobacter calidifons]NHB76895.1 formimidoylglutamate deiminase [Rhodobacter calidifons]